MSKISLDPSIINEITSQAIYDMGDIFFDTDGSECKSDPAFQYPSDIAHQCVKKAIESAISALNAPESKK